MILNLLGLPRFSMIRVLHQCTRFGTGVHTPMSYLLSNRSTNTLQTISRDTWSRILGLARFYGWQPMGTLPPFLYNLRKTVYGAESAWDGNYLRNEGQVVCAEDALLIAQALEHSLDDIPDENLERGAPPEDHLHHWLADAALEDDDEPSPVGILPFEYFAGEAKQNLLDFIRFCSLGEFLIL